MAVKIMLLEVNPHGRSILCAATMWCLFFIMAVLIRNSDLKHRATNKSPSRLRDRVSSSSDSSGGTGDVGLLTLTKDNITIGVQNGVSVVAYNALEFSGKDKQIVTEYLLKNVKDINVRHIQALKDDYPKLEYGCDLTDSRICSAVKKRPQNSFIENEYGAFSRPETHHNIFVRIALVEEPLKRLISSFEKARQLNREERPRMAVDEHFLSNNCEAPFAKSLLCGHIVTDSFIVNYFCGCKSRCFTDGEWALERAKFNIINHFAVVGVAEQVDAYAYILEKLMPAIFKATPLVSLSRKLANETLHRDSLRNFRLNQFLEKRLSLDFELFGFIKRRFAKQKRALRID